MHSKCSIYRGQRYVLTPTPLFPHHSADKQNLPSTPFHEKHFFFFFLGDWFLACTIRNYCIVVIVEYSKICSATLQQTISDLVCNITGSTGAVRNKNSGVLGMGADFLHCVKILSYQHHVHNFLW